MGEGRPDSSSAAESWLPEGMKARSQANENGDAVSAEPVEKQARATDVIDAKLKEAEEALAEQRIRIAELETRLKEREAEFKQTLEQREAEYAEALRERHEALKEERLDAHEAEVRGKLDVNEATFEQFRDLGLSVTQSARLISHRDARGGFDSLDELDEVPGLPKGLKRTLRDQLELG